MRELQGHYVEVWVAVLTQIHPALDPREGRAAVHAVFGLLNSTPHSLRISRTAMASLLLDMVGVVRRRRRGRIATRAG